MDVRYHEPQPATTGSTRSVGLDGLSAIVGPAVMHEGAMRRGSILEKVREQGLLFLGMRRSDARRSQRKCGHEQDGSGAKYAEEDVSHGDHRRCSWRPPVNSRTAPRFPKTWRKNPQIDAADLHR